MTHPPIPPKSKWFEVLTCPEAWDENFRGKAVFWTQLRDFLLMEDIATKFGPRTRQMVASIAEVEWRRRDDRLTDIYARLAQRWDVSNGGFQHLTKEQSDRLSRLEDASYVIQDIQAAWRKWGWETA